MVDDREAYQALTAVGFKAAELRVLSAQLAEACARCDFDSACELAETLLSYQRDFRDRYTALVTVGIPDHRLWAIDGHGGLQDRGNEMSSPQGIASTVADC